MARRNLRCLEQQRARLEQKVSPETAALIESDTNVMTARPPKNERSFALKYREIVRRQAAGA